MSTEPITIVEADLSRSAHGEATLQLLNAYAMDPRGDGNPPPAPPRRGLFPALRQPPTTMVFLAGRGPEPVGLAVCFRGFSPSAARPLLTLHDFYVAPAC